MRKPWSERVRLMMEATCLPPREFAMLLGCDQRIVSRWLDGSTPSAQGTTTEMMDGLEIAFDSCADKADFAIRARKLAHIGGVGLLFYICFTKPEIDKDTAVSFDQARIRHIFKQKGLDNA